MFSIRLSSSLVCLSVSPAARCSAAPPAHLAWRARRPWGRRTRWGRQPGPCSGWRPPAGGAGPGRCSCSCPAGRGRGRAARAAGSCPAAATTGWRTAGRARSTPPPAGWPGGRGQALGGGGGRGQSRRDAAAFQYRVNQKKTSARWGWIVSKWFAFFFNKCKSTHNTNKTITRKWMFLTMNDAIFFHTFQATLSFEQWC